MHLSEEQFETLLEAMDAAQGDGQAGFVADGGSEHLAGCARCQGRLAAMQATRLRLRAALGAPVSVARGRRGGRIVIRFHSDDELEGIVERLRG